MSRRDSGGSLPMCHSHFGIILRSVSRVDGSKELNSLGAVAMARVSREPRAHVPLRPASLRIHRTVGLRAAHNELRSTYRSQSPPCDDSVRFHCLRDV